MTFFAKSAKRSTATLAAGITVAGAAAVGISAPAQAATVATWDRLAQCESGGNWSINTGNGYYGGLQFALTSWRAVGGSGYPHQASKAEQINRAEKLLAIQGWRAWPACSQKLGLTAADAAGSSATAVERTSAVDTAAQQRAAAERAAAQKAAAERAEAQRQAQQKAAADRWAAKVAAERTASQKAEADRQAAAEKAAAERAADRQAAIAQREEARRAAAQQETIVIVAGDTLFSLANKHRVEGGWEALYAANTSIIDDPNLIYVGQELTVPRG